MTVPEARSAPTGPPPDPVGGDGRRRTAGSPAPETTPGGCVAAGTFEAYGRVGDEPAAVYTRAGLFQRGGRRTPVTVRFGTVAGGPVEAARGPRRFAVGFRTEDGAWDLAGSTLPVHAARDAGRRAEVLRALGPDPATGRPAPERLFDLLAGTPESMHLITWLFSPRGIPANHRTQDGFGVDTYRMVNAAGGGVLVRYHWCSQQGVVSLTAEQADRIGAAEPCHASRDLAEAIDRGEHPRWELTVQVMSDDGHPGLDFDPLDATKTWPVELFPQRPVGMLTLDGGVGAAAADPPGGPAVTVEGLGVPVDAARRLAWEPADDYGQAGARFRSMPGWERDDLVRNLTAALQDCGARVRQAMLRHFGRCDPAYGELVARGLGPLR